MLKLYANLRVKRSGSDDESLQVSAAMKLEKNANRALRLIKRNFEYINKEAFEVLCGALVRP